jgi:predicted DNA-binding transcriptional regulator AlpA
MPSHNERLVDVQIVSQLTGIKVRTLRKWRTEGRGPAAMRVEGRLVRYSLRVVEDWIRDQPGVTSGGKSETAA